MKTITIFLLILFSPIGQAQLCITESGKSLHLARGQNSFTIKDLASGSSYTDHVVGSLPTSTGGYYWGSRYIISHDLDLNKNYIGIITESGRYSFAFPKFDIICGLESDFFNPQK